MRGDVIAVGSPTDCDPSNGTDTGSAYVYEKHDGVWMLAARLTAADAHDGDWFGWDVAVTDDAVLVGKRWGDERSLERTCNPGSAYPFRRNGLGWVQTAKLVPSDGACGDEFGYSVALSPEHAIVGAWLADDARGGIALLAGAGALPLWGSDSGAAYVFETGAPR